MSDSMPAGQFKAKCLMVMDRVKKYGETVTITKHGKPVAKLVPVNDESVDYKTESPFGLMKGSIEIKGDIVSVSAQMSPDDQWDAEKD
jgi:prevent-host-death family protein